MSLLTHEYLSGCTNNQIVDIVARTFTIRSLIRKMISSSSKDQSDGDLEQYVYLTLLQMPNERLLKLYNEEKLRNFISQIIKRQNWNGSFYRRVKLKENVDPLNHESVTTEQDFLPDLLFAYIKSQIEFDEFREYSEPEVKRILAFTLLDKYICSKKSMRHMSSTLKISRKTISLLIGLAKSEIINWYNQEGQFINDEYIKKLYDK